VPESSRRGGGEAAVASSRRRRRYASAAVATQRVLAAGECVFVNVADFFYSILFKLQLF
jgi:hypothetical protein